MRLIMSGGEACHVKDDVPSDSRKASATAVPE
jgi:hypothetical protein